MLDTKAVQLASAGAVVMGLSGTTALREPGDPTVWLVVAAGFFFAAVAGLTIWTVFPRPYRVTDAGPQVWDLWDQDPVGAKVSIMAKTADTYEPNDRANRRKAGLLPWIVVALLLEVLLVVAAIATALLST